MNQGEGGAENRRPATIELEFSINPEDTLFGREFVAGTSSHLVLAATPGAALAGYVAWWTEHLPDAGMPLRVAVTVRAYHGEGEALSTLRPTPPEGTNGE